MLRWFFYLFMELKITLNTPPTLLRDNKSTIFMSKIPTITTRSRHIEVSYYFVTELVNKGALKIEYVPSYQRFTDGFTKTLKTDDFLHYRDQHKLVLVPPVVGMLKIVDLPLIRFEGECYIKNYKCRPPISY